MKVFLAGTAAFSDIVIDEDIPFILESFFYFEDWQIDYIKKCKMFLLDSGAFTFMQNNGGEPSWEEYIDRYADFITRNNIQYFFELDVDSVIGYEKVKKLRKVLETKVGRKCIPVWHYGRGKEEFISLCKDYEYVAIGGIVTGEIKPTMYEYFPWFIRTAHENGCMIHGLGFTNMVGLTKYHFDTVDSTNWVSGGRFGSFARFDGKRIRTAPPPNGMRSKSARVINKHNLREWIKFQKYAEVNL